MLIITFKDSEAIAGASTLVAVISRVFNCLVSCTLFRARAFDITAEDGSRPQEMINAIHASFEAD